MVAIDGQNANIKQLVDDIARPVYNYRLAVGMLAGPGDDTHPQKRGARNRMLIAEAEIVAAIDAFNEREK